MHGHILVLKVAIVNRVGWEAKTLLVDLVLTG